MSFYIKSLFFAIPIFTILIIIEEIISRIKGQKVNQAIDVISSLSSGNTNITKDGMKLSLVLISYPWLVEHLTIIKIEPIWAAVLIAILVQDFSGYWLHRLNHRVNLFWNRHIIHHSSEEFNLSCALRQSLSEMVHFGAILMIPAAILGVPAQIFAFLGPIHLFMQFWYHTKLINKMGWLEYIIVTPSHHRVHHAINPEYIDKNYGQILIIWDKLFGSFQSELNDVIPVYGVLRPVKSWNPILINYKHLWQLFKDAYHAQNLWDKIRIWFMPTGWRPDDVSNKFPIETIQNPKNQKKYKTDAPLLFVFWSFFQLNISTILMLHFFNMIHIQNPVLNYSYGGFIIFHIFSFTSALDRKKYSIGTEIFKLLFILGLLYEQNFIWFGLDNIYSYIIIIYAIISITITSYFNKDSK
tara:strand:- start:433 stop:1668 length:1236 start_codon:yes stop_codon:yes gene_type:complete